MYWKAKRIRVSVAIFFVTCLLIVPGISVASSNVPVNFLLLRQETNVTLSSDTFSDGQAIGQEYTQEGANTSPQLSWENIPDGTDTFRIIMQDLDDTDLGHEKIHWVVENIPASVNSLAAGAGANDSSLPSGASHRANDFGHVQYDGPVTVNSPSHTYQFTIFALDASLNTLAEGTITVTY